MNNFEHVPGPILCERCGEELDRSKAVWLELSIDTGNYAKSVPEDESQGFFPFGTACAKAVLKNGGECVRIGLAK